MYVGLWFYNRKTRNGEDLFFSGRIIHGEHQAACFISLKTLRLLLETEDLHADSTYKSAPVLFKELFTVHAIAFDNVSNAFLS